MNVKQSFIKSTEKGRIIEIIEERLNGRLKDVRLCYPINVPDSYSAILANDEKRKIEETQEAIIMKIETQERYKKKQNLYVDRKTLKPKTFEIIDMNENEKVYITYNEIELNI